MLEISRRQFAIFEKDYRFRRRLRFVKALRACGWIDGAMPDALALNTVDAVLDDAKRMGIVEDEDAVRFAALAFIPERERQTPRLSTLIDIVLTDTDADPTRRLDFVYEVGRLRKYGADPLPFAPYVRR